MGRKEQLHKAACDFHDEGPITSMLLFNWHA
jgi:hypothetical protein